MLMYVAGPYSADTAEGVLKNIEAARQGALELWQEGHAVICPHLNTQHMETDLSYEQVLAGDMVMIARCDALYMLRDWERSPGAQREFNYAKDRGIPIYLQEWGAPTVHPTELQSPNQVEGFMHTIMQLYRTHLSKNQDYSPANILATGEVGLVTRLWDKTARLLNLSGFRIYISDTGTFEKPREPKNESIEDTYLDLACYGVIGLGVRKGWWGR